MRRFRFALTTTLVAVMTAAPSLASWEDGVAAFRAGRYQEAAETFQSFVASSPDTPEGHYMLGMSLVRQQRHGQALETLRKALDLGPTDARYSLAVAQAQLKLNRANDALETLRTAPAVPEAMRKNFHQLLALTAGLVDSSRADDTRPLLEKALAADSTSKSLWMALADISHHQNLPAEKFSALAKAFDIDPKDAELGKKAMHVAISMAQSETADTDEKAGWYRKAAKLGKSLVANFPTSENLMRVGEAEMAAHEYDNAINRFERLRAAGANDARLHYYLGSSNQALKRDDEALTHLKNALDRSPDPKLAQKIHTARGWSYRNRDEFDLASVAFRQAGNVERADEMAGYAENRREWAREKASCTHKRAEIDKMREDSEGLEGTAEWDELNREFEDFLTACEPYFQDQS